MRVAVIDSVGKILATGEWDGAKVDNEFARVNGELYHCAYVYHDDFSDKVSEAIRSSHRAIKDAEAKHLDTLMQMGNLYRARSK